MNRKATAMSKSNILLSSLLVAGCSASSTATPGSAPPPSTAAQVAEAPPAAVASSPASSETLREGEYQKLGLFVGQWRGTGSLQMGENTAPVTSTFSCEVAKGGVAVACTHEAQIEGVGPLVENALLGLDPTDGQLHWYNINTMGETHDHVGRWSSDHSIDWSFEGTAEGHPMVESITMDLGPDTMTFRSETKVGGQTAALFEGTLQRS